MLHRSRLTHVRPRLLRIRPRLIRSGPHSLVQVALPLVLSLMLLVAGALVLRPAPAAAGGPRLTAAVSGSPFKGSGSRSRVRLSVALSAAVRLTIRVKDYDGHLVRVMLDRRSRSRGTTRVTWDGRDRKGHLVPDGPYLFRVVARTPSGSASLVRWVTKASRELYPARPGAIVVAINPGHGGSDPGAIVAHTREADINLDIAMRVRQMLESAGVKVVMTRATNRDVNRPAMDRNADGRIDHADELVARNDVGNLARADLMLNIHDNAASCRCGQGTEVFVNRSRPWSAESLRLGTAVLAAHIRRLRAFQSRNWKVHDRGIGPGHYVSLRGATATSPRPALMPAILGESLFLDTAPERARLRDPHVRTAIAAAYYDGVSSWLASRRTGIRYSRIDAPAELPAGGDGTVRVRLTNTGQVRSSGWHLEGRLVPRVLFYDGSGAVGRLVGSVPLPNGLRPGGSVDLALPITMPTAARDWLLKLDVVRSSGRLSDRGVVQAQVPIRTSD